MKHYKGLATGIKRLQEKRIVHGNIKPSNIMMKDPSDHQLKIADFFEAGFKEEIAGRGTPFFNAPERNCPNMDVVMEYSQDVYALIMSVIMIEVGSFEIFKTMSQSDAYNTCDQNNFDRLKQLLISFVLKTFSIQTKK